jgi:hypothetical protein
MIIYSIYIKDILIRFATYILLVHLFRYDLDTICPGPIQINENGTTFQYDNDLNTFYFEI